MSDEKGAMGEWGTNPSESEQSGDSDDGDNSEGYTPVLTKTSCPWCLYPEEQFIYHDNGKVTCENCRATIPVDMEWYQRGEKICV